MINLKSFLIFAWNDYISEVDDPPREALRIEDVDLNLEGFRERFNYEVSQYEAGKIWIKNYEGLD